MIKSDFQDTNQEFLKIEKQIIEESDLIFVTLNSSGNRELDDLRGHIDTLFVDESSQARETECLIPLRFMPRKVVLFGDCLQLQPTVASRNGLVKSVLGKSLFERLIEQGVMPYFLDKQYRMHPTLSFFPNRRFYSSRIKDSRHVLQRKDPKVLEGFLSSGRNYFFDIDGREERNPTSKSYSNSQEIEAIISFLDRILEGRSRSYTKKISQSIGILVSYNEQKARIKKRVLKEFDFNFDVNTIDGYQGREKDIILISLVRTKESLGFMNNYRRLNVSITRAKYGLFIFGKVNHFESNDHWKSYIELHRTRESLIEKHKVDDVIDMMFDERRLVIEDSDSEGNEEGHRKVEAGVDFYKGQKKMDPKNVIIEDTSKKEDKGENGSNKGVKISGKNRLQDLLDGKIN